MATHSSVLAWRIPGTGEPGGLPSMGSYRVGHDWSDLAAGLYSPWNSPGQNTGVSSLSLLQGIFPTQGLNPGLPHQVDSLPAESQGKPKNTGVGSLSLLQQIFLTQESNQGLLHCRWILYQLSCQGSPRIPEWVAYPFSSKSSWPRNRTQVSWIAGEFFTNWAIREAVLFIFRCNSPYQLFSRIKCYNWG